ncbi:11526_t:CDS:2 [Funneliformis geosporum]|nr:11526_t:CDS:2 [Funneliformis geosporum]
MTTVQFPKQCPNCRKRYWDQSTRARQPCKVALKSLNSETESLQIFIEEVRSHYEVHNTSFMSNSFPMYGLSQDPDTKEYLIVMPFVENGNLRSYLNQNFHVADWEFKLQLLYSIAFRLSHIHSRNMVHRDLHGGNILVMIDKDGNGRGEISDFGLCRSTADNVEEGDVFGVLPYIAPEVLKGGTHTTAADIYAFGVIMCEMTTGQPAFCDRAHDVSLLIDILNGTQPKILDDTPKEYYQLAKRCLDSDPDNRPGAWELRNFFSNRYVTKSVPPEYRVADERKKNILPQNSHQIYHSDAIYTSRNLGFTKSVNQLKNTNLNQDIFDSSQVNLQIPDGF